MQPRLSTVLAPAALIDTLDMGAVEGECNQQPSFSSLRQYYFSFVRAGAEGRRTGTRVWDAKMLKLAAILRICLFHNRTQQQTAFSI